MTDQLHHLIDAGAEQPVINERVAGLLEACKIALTDHEKRIRFLERTINYALGVAGAISLILYLISVLRK